MTSNLPPVMPVGSSGAKPNPSTGHAQNFSTSQLKQHKERAKATTSIGHAGDDPADKTATTSIHHQGKERAQARTSINSPAQMVNDGDDGYDQEAADRRRYAHIRGKIKERQAKEAEELAMSKPGKVALRKGRSFKLSGFGGLKKTMRGVVKKDRYQKKGMSASDRKILNKIIEDRAKNKSTGSKFSFRDRRKLGREARKHYKSGSISYSDYKNFKKIIGGLE